MADVVISEFMDQDVAERLISDFDTHWDPDLWSRRADLLHIVTGARAIVVRNATQVNPELSGRCATTEGGRADGRGARQYRCGGMQDAWS